MKSLLIAFSDCIVRLLSLSIALGGGFILAVNIDVTPGVIAGVAAITAGTSLYVAVALSSKTSSKASKP